MRKISTLPSMHLFFKSKIFFNVNYLWISLPGLTGRRVGGKGRCVGRIGMGRAGSGNTPNKQDIVKKYFSCSNGKFANGITEIRQAKYKNLCLWLKCPDTAIFQHIDLNYAAWELERLLNVIYISLLLLLWTIGIKAFSRTVGFGRNKDTNMIRVSLKK